MAMAWIVLIVAGVFETGWAVGLKYSEGFTRFWPSVWTVVCLVISMLLLGWSVRTLPLGTAYAVWTGIGAVGAVLVGILVFREPATAARLVCLGLIVSGIVGLKIFSGPSA
jgi:quaternary ammonium compound-resistance protein SugE